MKLRIVSGALWFLAGWAIATTIAFVLGLNQVVGPLVGIIWAAFVVADPRHLLWQAGLGLNDRVGKPGSQGGAARQQVGVDA